MALPEFVKVRRGGIVLEVNRGEAPRYVRLGYALVEEKPEAPQVVIEPVVPQVTLELDVEPEINNAADVEPEAPEEPDTLVDGDADDTEAAPVKRANKKKGSVSQ